MRRLGRTCKTLLIRCILSSGSLGKPLSHDRTRDSNITCSVLSQHAHGSVSVVHKSSFSLVYSLSVGGCGLPSLLKYPHFAIRTACKNSRGPSTSQQPARGWGPSHEPLMILFGPAYATPNTLPSCFPATNRDALFSNRAIHEAQSTAHSQRCDNGARRKQTREANLARMSHTRTVPSCAPDAM